MKKSSALKKIFIMMMIISFSLNSYAAISVSDGSAFATKAELSAGISNLSDRMSQLENSLSEKIDSLVSSYISRNGIWNGSKQTLNTDFTKNDVIGGYKMPFPYILRNTARGTGSSKGWAALMADNILGSVKVFDAASKSGMLILDMQLRRVDGGSDIRNTLFWGRLNNLTTVDGTNLSFSGMQPSQSKSCFYGFDLATDEDFLNIKDSFLKCNMTTATYENGHAGSIDGTSNYNTHTVVGFTLKTDRDFRQFFISKGEPLYMRERFNYNLGGVNETTQYFYFNLVNYNSNATRAASLFYYIYSCNIY